MYEYPKLFATALSGILMEDNGECHDELNPYPDDWYPYWFYRPDDYLSGTTGMLASSWGIRNKQDLLQIIESLKDGMHSYSYAAVYVGYIDEETAWEIILPVSQKK